MSDVGDRVLFHLFEEDVIRTFSYDGELYAVYHMPNQLTLTCSRVKRVDDALLSSRTGRVSEWLTRLLKRVNSFCKNVFNVGVDEYAYAVLNSKYDYITSSMGFTLGLRELTNSLSEEEADALLTEYVLGLDDGKELFDFFFDGYMMSFASNERDRVARELRSVTADDPRLTKLFDDSLNFYAESDAISDRVDTHLERLRKLAEC